MSATQAGGRGRIGFFARNFTLLGLVVCIGVLLLSFFHYTVSRDALQDEVFEANKVTTGYFTEKIDTMLQDMQSVAYELMSGALTEVFISQRVNIGNWQHTVALNNLSSTEMAVMQANPLLAGVRMYSFLNGMCVSDAGIWSLGDHETASLMTFFGDLEGNRWVYGRNDIPVDGATANPRFVCRLLNGYTRPGGLLVLEMKQDDFLRQIERMTLRETGYVAVLDEAGQFLVNDPAQTDAALSQALLAQLQGQDGADGLTIAGDRGRYLVSYTASAVNRWKYIAIVSEADVFSSIAAVGKSVQLLSILCVSFVALAVAMMARRISKPVNQVYRQLYPGQGRAGRDGDELAQISRQIDRILGTADSLSSEKQALEAQNEKLRQDIDVSRDTLEQYTLYRLFFGDGNEGGADIDTHDLPAAGRYTALIVRLEALDTDAPEDATSDGLMRLLLRLLREKHGDARAIVLRQGGEVTIHALVRSAQDDTPELDMADLKAQCAFFANLVGARFALRCTVGIGMCVQSLADVRVSMEAARRMLFLGGTGMEPSIHVFSGDDMEEGLPYFTLRAQLAQSLQAAAPDAYGDILTQYFLRVRGERGTAEELRLFGRDSINILYDFLASGEGKREGLLAELTDGFFHFDTAFPTLGRLIDWETDILRRAAAQRPESISQNEVVRAAVRLLEKHYGEDISLTWVADQLAVSPSYLSRLFRSETGEAFKEYLTELKIASARELLETTTQSVGSIAAQVGYNNPKQFSAMFSKRLGVSPLEYRRKHYQNL